MEGRSLFVAHACCPCMQQQHPADHMLVSWLFHARRSGLAAYAVPLQDWCVQQGIHPAAASVSVLCCRSLHITSLHIAPRTPSPPNERTSCASPGALQPVVVAVITAEAASGPLQSACCRVCTSISVSARRRSELTHQDSPVRQVSGAASK